MTSVQLVPDHNQVVFEGDSFRVHCKVPSITLNYDIQDTQATDHIKWLWTNQNPKDYFNDLIVENRFIAESGYIESTLTVPRLNRNHSGMWSCELDSNQRHYTKSIVLLVINEETMYCPITTTENNKGTYIWPKTVVNFTVSLPCQSVQINFDESVQQATYFCAENGEWKNLNTTNCSYISETTKILQQSSQMNLTLTKDSILETAKRFKNYTADLKMLKDVMDLVYVVRTLENYFNYLNIEPGLGSILLDIINYILDLSNEYIVEADTEGSICGKITQMVERISWILPESSAVQKVRNIIRFD